MQNIRTYECNSDREILSISMFNFTLELEIHKLTQFGHLFRTPIGMRLFKMTAGSQIKKLIFLGKKKVNFGNLIFDLILHKNKFFLKIFD